MTYRPEGPGWRSGKQQPAPSKPHTHDIRVVYVITEGEQGDDYYNLIDLVGAEEPADLDALRAEFYRQYRFSEDEDPDSMTTDTFDNVLLRGLDLMRADGYSDDDLKGAIFAHPRLATLFAAWLVRAKGFISLHWHEHNVEQISVLSERTVDDIHRRRAFSVAHGLDPMTPWEEAPDSDDVDLDPPFDVDEEYAYHWGAIQAREHGIPLLGEKQ
ncbi:MAG: hypothetical protein M3Y74_13685 [Chloroflexota bacterium]|nr:hypothetical protein [Chloroflexota bacterium]